MSSEGGRPSSDGESVGLTSEMNGCVVLLLPPELELDADMGTAVSWSGKYDDCICCRLRR